MMDKSVYNLLTSLLANTNLFPESSVSEHGLPETLSSSSSTSLSSPSPSPPYTRTNHDILYILIQFLFLHHRYIPLSNEPTEPIRSTSVGTVHNDGVPATVPETGMITTTTTRSRLDNLPPPSQSGRMIDDNDDGSILSLTNIRTEYDTIHGVYSTLYYGFPYLEDTVTLSSSISSSSFLTSTGSTTEENGDQRNTGTSRSSSSGTSRRTMIPSSKDGNSRTTITDSSRTVSSYPYPYIMLRVLSFGNTVRISSTVIIPEEDNKIIGGENTTITTTTSEASSSSSSLSTTTFLTIPLVKEIITMNKNVVTTNVRPLYPGLLSSSSSITTTTTITSSPNVSYWYTEERIYALGTRIYHHFILPFVNILHRIRRDNNSKSTMNTYNNELSIIRTLPPSSTTCSTPFHLFSSSSSGSPTTSTTAYIPTLLTLPVNAFTLIIDYLVLPNYGKVTSTCKLLHEYVNKEELAWKLQMEKLIQCLNDRYRERISSSYYQCTSSIPLSRITINNVYFAFIERCLYKYRMDIVVFSSMVQKLVRSITIETVQEWDNQQQLNNNNMYRTSLSFDDNTLGKDTNTRTSVPAVVFIRWLRECFIAQNINVSISTSTTAADSNHSSDGGASESFLPPSKNYCFTRNLFQKLFIHCQNYATDDERQSYYNVNAPNVLRDFRYSTLYRTEEPLILPGGLLPLPNFPPLLRPPFDPDPFDRNSLFHPGNARDAYAALLPSALLPPNTDSRGSNTYIFEDQEDEDSY